MSKDDKFYAVIYESAGRMYPCKCGHETPESAFECVKAKKGLSIMEWVKNRNPQFQEFWRSDKVAEPS